MITFKISDYGLFTYTLTHNRITGCEFNGIIKEPETEEQKKLLLDVLKCSNIIADDSDKIPYDWRQFVYAINTSENELKEAADRCNLVITLPGGEQVTGTGKNSNKNPNRWEEKQILFDNIICSAGKSYV